MTTADLYIRSVTRCLPPAGPLRPRIEMELRGIVAEGQENGRDLGQILGQLGKPEVFAHSYLGAEPLVSGPIVTRVLAKVTDLLIVVMAILPALVLAGKWLPEDMAGAMVVAGLVGGFLAFGTTTIGAEYWSGQTPGKRMFGLHVVQESGAAITFGQSVVRQLPMILQTFWIDCVFAFFTDRQQRAFEVLSKTRVVLTAPPLSPLKRR